VRWVASGVLVAARCGDYQVAQILLPTALTVRRADGTKAIGNALVAHARGAGHRSIAAQFGHPESTVRRWLRGVRARTRSGCTGGAWTVPPRSIGDCWGGIWQGPAGHGFQLVRGARSQPVGALNLLAGAPLRFRDRFGTAVPAATIELLPTPPF
jgi:hypothetical protein